MDEQHLQAFDQLSNGADPATRREAAARLFSFEQRGEISEDDLLTLLFGDDLVIRGHAVRALGEIKSQKAILPLSRLFESSQDPILLQELLEAFVLIGSEVFLPLVMNRISPSRWQVWLKKFKDKRQPKPLFDEPFIIEQILLDVLKYLQTCKTLKINRTIKGLLDHEDPMIRLNCLQLYGKIGCFPTNTTLEALQQHDPHPLVRQQANLLAQHQKE